MEKKISVQLSLNEIAYICNSLSLHEFNDVEDMDESWNKHYEFIVKMCTNLIKRYRSSGYSNETINIMEKNINYVKSKLKK
jgi:hypothetical protein